ncbi:hypothetical protein conserved [Leishmania donovani]|uniref:Hypothetical_protein_conserved n=1 Tax=Leishmania donovani TaxID=5661 RepID=A0A3S7X9J2_LEIDO|nr:hypothetical protein, conserved [Leishmania donovani]AYU83132.1 hypothetical protein LdCL_350038200 [Leishmania donovani]TPP44593.1 hypothetical protein CGC21_7130 [Leishmania donovani]TPP48001.1 hypothetical protein CGC20_15075 [Leishmania donovani]CAJ1993141.1 hypothetical protein conserved [Leishmania donovani]CBZ38232.1 hypothetical protein, conserved [Leishmania donovani]
MATEVVEEEWQDGVDDFFADFSLAASNEKSTRRKNAEAHQASVAQSQNKVERREADRGESAEEARRRITAAVISRATAKELERAARNAKQHHKMSHKNCDTGASSVKLGHSSSSLSEQHHGSSTAASLSPSLKVHDSTAHQVEAAPSYSRLCKKNQKIDAKFARKTARKEAAKEHRIKYRRVLRKQRR